MTKTGLLLIVVLFFYACGEEKPPLTVHQQVIKEEGFTPDTLCGEYRRYTGTVAGQPVVLHYMQYGSTVTCQYYYENQGKNIHLYSTADNPRDNPLVLTEQPETERKEDPATWRVSFEGDSLKGEWISGDGSTTHPILLKEDYTGGAIPFSIVCMNDSTRFTDDRPEPYASTAYQVLLPAGNDETTRFVRAVIYTRIGCDSINGDDIKSCLDVLKTKYFADYRDVSEEERKLLDANSQAFNWSEQTNFWVVYNTDGMVVLNHHIYAYTGGAHGNYSSDYICIDAVNKKLLQLHEILQPDTSRLVKLLEEEARKLYEVQDDLPLTANMLTDELYIPEQYYFSNKGIT
ncbi:MAG: DUF4163 domain-containing protein, partial [Taibaiella sp.]|nr:DUF4163 domain-containing protein [Taibaiella sp.]